MTPLVCALETWYASVLDDCQTSSPIYSAVFHRPARHLVISSPRNSTGQGRVTKTKKAEISQLTTDERGIYTVESKTSKENEFRDSKERNVMVFQVTPMLPVGTRAGYQPIFTQRQVGLPVDCRCGCYRLPQIKMLQQTMDCDWSQAKPSSLRCTLYTVWPAGYRPAGRQDWYRLSLRAHTRRRRLWFTQLHCQRLSRIT